MKQPKTLARLVASVYFLCVSLLLIFYGITIVSTVLYSEDRSTSNRMMIVAPEHIKIFQLGAKGVVSVDPLTNVYDGYDLLPSDVKEVIEPQWRGVTTHHSESDKEYVIYATDLALDKTTSIVAYVVEDTTDIEWNDEEFSNFFFGLTLLGLIFSLVMAKLILNRVARVSVPLALLSTRLQSLAADNFDEIDLGEVESKELQQTLSAINQYRKNIEILIAREKSFTRYVSHEIRTPLMVIRGSLSVLKKQSDEPVRQHQQIADAVEQLEQLTSTFLLLAREQTDSHAQAVVDASLIQDISTGIDLKAKANQCEVTYDLKSDFSLNAEPLLLRAVLENILINAVNSSVGGNVVCEIDEQVIQVTDNGVGLSNQSRGYEGFGIGLLIVKDVCQKYGWQFSLEDNKQAGISDSGCTAKIQF